MSDNCCCKKVRSEQELKKLTNRLSRVEGQIRGIRAMLEEDAYCIDILTQVSAASAALNSFSRELLSEHIKTCVTNDIKNGKTDKTDELIEALDKIIK